MIFIYSCYGGTHSSSIASSIHLGILPLDDIPSKKIILNSPYFDKLKYKDMGKIIYRGVDRWGNSVYTLGRGSSKALLPAVLNLISLLKEKCDLKEEVVIIDASPTVTPLMMVGGFLSRAVKLHFIGRPLLAISVQKAYYNIAALVKVNLERYGYKL